MIWVICAFVTGWNLDMMIWNISPEAVFNSIPSKHIPPSSWAQTEHPHRCRFRRIFTSWWLLQVAWLNISGAQTDPSNPTVGCLMASHGQVLQSWLGKKRRWRRWRCREMTSLVTGGHWRAGSWLQTLVAFEFPSKAGGIAKSHGCQKICWHPKWIKMDGLTWFNARNCHTWGPYSLLTPQFFSISIDWRCVVPIEWWCGEGSSGWISYEITWN